MSLLLFITSALVDNGFVLAQATVPMPIDDPGWSKLVNALAVFIGALGSAIAYYVGMKKAGQTTTPTVAPVSNGGKTIEQLHALQRKLDDNQMKEEIKAIIAETRGGIERRIDQHDLGWKTLWEGLRAEVHDIKTSVAVLDAELQAVHSQLRELRDRDQGLRDTPPGRRR